MHVNQRTKATAGKQRGQMVTEGFYNLKVPSYFGVHLPQLFSDTLLVTTLKDQKKH